MMIMRLTRFFVCHQLNSGQDEDLIRLIAAAAQQVGTVIGINKPRRWLKHYAHRLEISTRFDRGIIEATSIQAVVEAALSIFGSLFPLSA